MNKAIKFDLIAVVGEYTNAQGENKKRFAKIGSLFDKGNNNISGKIDNIPVGWDGWFAAKPPLDKQAPRTQYKGLPKDEDDFDEPF